MWKKLLAIAGLAVLGGCVSNAPKMTPEELREKRLSTLNIYEDNRVAIRVDRSGRRGGNDIIFINESKDEAVVYSTGREYFNALDIVKITQDKDDKLVTFFLKNGENKGVSKSGFSTLWCDKNKKCRPKRSGEMKTIYEWTLKRGPERDPSYDVVVEGAAPTMIENGIQIVSGAGYDKYVKSIDDFYARWPAAKAAIDTRRAQEQEKIAEAKKQAETVGQLNCTSTSYKCGGTYSDITSLNCGTFNSSVGEMAKNGWVAANVNAEFVRGSLGEMCDHNVYHFYYKR